VGLRIALADDSVLIREALASLIERAEGMELVAACADADELRDAVEARRVDVAVTDIRMPPTGTDEGIRLAAELRHTHPELGVVVLSAYCEPAYALDLLRDGSDGRAYLIKDRLHSPDHLIAAIEEVAHGGSVIDPKVVEALVSGEHSDRTRPLLAALSPREHEILAEMARGSSNQRIAEALGLTRRAVEKHINAIFSKLELPPTPDVSRRVRAVLLFLLEEGAPAGLEPRVG